MHWRVVWYHVYIPSPPVNNVWCIRCQIKIPALFIELLQILPTLPSEFTVSRIVRLQTLHTRPVYQIQVDGLHAKSLQRPKTRCATFTTPVVFRSLYISTFCTRKLFYAITRKSDSEQSTQNYCTWLQLKWRFAEYKTERHNNNLQQEIWYSRLNNKCT